MKVRHKLGNLPVIGRYIYPLYNQYSIFSAQGKYNSFAVNQSISNFNHPKVVVFGLPKSGNTWIFSLLKDYLDLPPIHIHHEKNKSGVGMIHDSYHYNLLIRKDFFRGVYIIRDVRDIIVSYFHYVQTDYYKELNDSNCKFDTLESFYYQYFLTKLVYRYKWFQHTEDFTSRGIPVVRYEDLYDNPEATFKNLIIRMGLKVDEVKIREVVENNNITNLKKDGKVLWKKVPTTHFRKGGYGNYKNELSEELLRDINSRFGDLLTRWGYKLDFDE